MSPFSCRRLPAAEAASPRTHRLPRRAASRRDAPTAPPWPGDPPQRRRQQMEEGGGMRRNPARSLRPAACHLAGPAPAAPTRDADPAAAAPSRHAGRARIPFPPPLRLPFGGALPRLTAAVLPREGPAACGCALTAPSGAPRPRGGGRRARPGPGGSARSGPPCRRAFSEAEEAARACPRAPRSCKVTRCKRHNARPPPGRVCGGRPHPAPDGSAASDPGDRRASAAGAPPPLWARRRL